MKIFNYSLIFIALLWLGACSKDVGNYDYRLVNAITIDSLLQGDHHTDRIYTVSFNDTLKLRPTITGTVSKSDLSALDFYWTVDGDKVSDSPELDYVANKKFGKLLANFVVTDRSTKVTSSYAFFIDVVNPYKLGYYILSKKENGDAVLYCRSTIKTKATFEEVLIPNLNPLGKQPISIASSRKYGSSSSDYFNQITLGIRESTYPVVILDSRNFLPTLLYNQQSFVGEGAFTFDPVKLSVSPVLSELVIYATNSDGKLYSLWKGAISQAQYAQDPLNYQASEKGLSHPYSAIQQLMSFYDVKNKKIRLFARDFANPRVYFFERSIDQYTRNSDLIKGQDYLFSAEAYGIDSTRFVYLMKSGNQLHSYKIGVTNNLLTQEVASELTKIAETNVDNVDLLGDIQYDINGRFWYVAIGTTIYRASVLGLDLVPYVTLPVDAKGVIHKFHMSNNRMIVGTLDPQTKKSSAYIYNLEDLSLEYSAHQLEQVVDLIVGI
jgi:hypothetical protein